MKWANLFVAILLTYLLWGLFLNRYSMDIIPGELAARDPVGFHDYAGVIHVHTKSSSGSGEISEIVAAAQTAGLDFLFLTDLNQFEPVNQNLAGYHDNLLLFIDGEFTYLNSHLLNIGVSAERDLSGPGRAQVFFSDLLSQTQRPSDQGIFILAHPLKPRYNWTGDYPAGLDGLEIINLKSLWQNAWLRSRVSFFWSLFIFPFNDRLAMLRLFQDPREEVKLWDDLSLKHPTSGFAGADAEAKFRITDSVSLNYPSYQTLFSIVRNHVLLPTEMTGDERADREKILGALRRGQFYMSLDTLADPKGFLAIISGPQNAQYLPGAEFNWEKGLELKVLLPQRPTVPFEVEVYRDGEKMLQSNSLETKVPLYQPGVYRIKVRVRPKLPLPDGKQWIPWIYTNPFYVRN